MTKIRKIKNSPVLLTLFLLGCGASTDTEGRAANRVTEEDPTLAELDGGTQSEPDDDTNEEEVESPPDDEAEDEPAAPIESGMPPHTEPTPDPIDDPTEENPVDDEPPAPSSPDDPMGPIGEDPDDPIGEEPEACPSLEPATEQEIAVRLERLLWGTDGTELTAALAAQTLSLETPAEVGAQAEAMLDDPRAVGAITAFVKHWLELESEYLEFDEPLLTSAQDSTDLTIERLVFGTDAPASFGLKELIAGRWSVVDEHLAAFYGLSPNQEPWELRQLPSARGAGLLSQAAWLNAQANPSWRGAAIREHLLCTLLPEPPLSEPARDLPQGMTTRVTYEAHSRQPACAGCHSLMDPVGFGFEYFDTFGAYRSEEMGIPIDATGEFTELGLEFEGADGLGSVLTGELQSQVAACLASSALAYSLQESVPGSFAPECFESNNEDLPANFDATLLEWLVAIVSSQEFSSSYSSL